MYVRTYSSTYVFQSESCDITQYNLKYEIQAVGHYHGSGRCQHRSTNYHGTRVYVYVHVYHGTNVTVTLCQKRFEIQGLKLVGVLVPMQYHLVPLVQYVPWYITTKWYTLPWYHWY